VKGDVFESHPPGKAPVNPPLFARPRKGASKPPINMSPPASGREPDLDLNEVHFCARNGEQWSVLERPVRSRDPGGARLTRFCMLNWPRAGGGGQGRSPGVRSPGVRSPGVRSPGEVGCAKRQGKLCFARSVREASRWCRSSAWFCRFAKSETAGLPQARRV